jgi:protein phosphatase
MPDWDVTNHTKIHSKLEMLAGCLHYEDKLDKNLTAKKVSKLSYNSILRCDPHVPIWIDGAVQ